MSDLRTIPVALLKQALEALEDLGMKYYETTGETLHKEAYAALRAALEQPEPMCVGCEGKPTLQNSPCAVCGKIAQQEQEPVAWIDNSGHPRHIRYWQSATEKRLYGPLRPLYERPPRCEPEPPPEPIHRDRIRHRYQELAQYCEPGDMLDDDWFEAGVRWAEAQHEIV